MNQITEIWIKDYLGNELTGRAITSIISIPINKRTLKSAHRIDKKIVEKSLLKQLGMEKYDVNVRYTIIEDHLWRV